MTVQEIRDAFWDLIGQQEGSFDERLTSAKADRLIWQGFVELYKRAKPVDARASDTITVDSTGDNEYPLPDDFFSYISQEPFSVNGVPLQKVKKGQLNRWRSGWTEETGTGGDRPLAYYELGRPKTGPNAGKRCVAFFPHFSCEVTVDYTSKPRKFNDFDGDDEYADVNEDYHLAGPHWANWNFFRNQPESDSVGVAESKAFFEEQAGFLAEHAEEEMQEDFEPEITPNLTGQVNDYWNRFGDG